MFVCVCVGREGGGLRGEAVHIKTLPPRSTYIQDVIKHYIITCAVKAAAHLLWLNLSPSSKDVLRPHRDELVQRLEDKRSTCFLIG